MGETEACMHRRTNTKSALGEDCSLPHSGDRGRKATAAGFPRSCSAGNAGCRAEINHVELAVISLPSC